jgi:tellurite resistance protein TehA-like permease
MSETSSTMRQHATVMSAPPDGTLARPRRTGLRQGVRELNPAYFAVVMATGIVSQAMRLDRAARLSGILLGVGIAAYVLLAVAFGWRLASYRREVIADVRDPRRAFGFFTITAGSDVLAARLAGDGHTAVAVVLLLAGVINWVLLSYGLPFMLMSRADTRGLHDVNATWFLWAVATQSVAVGITSLQPHDSGVLAVLAVACWAVGVVLYLLIAGMMLLALLASPVRAAGLTPALWVFMGAAAISVLSGALLLQLPPSPLLAAARAVVAGLSVVLWAFGSWLIPLLVLAGVWRHLVRRVPLAYEPGLWSIAFPAGMYGVASHELGVALNVSWLSEFGQDEAWAALAVWSVILLAMAWTLSRRLISEGHDDDDPAHPARL